MRPQTSACAMTQSRLDSLRSWCAPAGRVALGIGPMSRACVDAALELACEQPAPIMLIASRRQIETAAQGSGYVDNWSTEDFARYVRRRDKSQRVILARDHGGPGQGAADYTAPSATSYGTARDSFEADILAGFDLIHLDPNRVTATDEQSLVSSFVDVTLSLYSDCHDFAARHGKHVGFEVGTDEGVIGDASAAQTAEIFDRIIAGCRSQGWLLPEFMVLKTGTKVMEMRNIGTLSTDLAERGEAREAARLRDLIGLCHNESVLVKEHNADYLDIPAIAWHCQSGVDAINVAPEFGVAETRRLLQIMRTLGLLSLREQFLKLAFDSRCWEKWMLPATTATDEDRAVIAGHYVFGTPEGRNIRGAVREVCHWAGFDLENSLKLAVKESVSRYLDALCGGRATRPRTPHFNALPRAA